MKLTDEWETPQWLFDLLNREFNFKVDLCANLRNAKCNNYYTDFLHSRNNLFSDFTELKSGDSLFMNPPYSNVFPFLDRAIYWSWFYDVTIVMLLKCDPSTKWWGLFWNYETQTARPNCEIRFIPRRLQFVRADKKLINANFPSVIVILNNKSGQRIESP